MADPISVSTPFDYFLYHGKEYAVLKDPRGQYQIVRVLRPHTEEETFKVLSYAAQARLAQAYADYPLSIPHLQRED